MKLKPIKLPSEPNILNQGGVSADHATQRLNQIITGQLTSRIETKKDYYYGFFKFPNQEQEIPVIFKTKPNLTQNSQVQLTGQWANSQKDRPSFTCSHYQLLKEPEPPTFSSLQETLRPLLNFSLEKKQEWIQRTDFLSASRCYS